MDYLSQQEKIKEYIKNNYPITLQSIGLEDMGDYIDDFLDLDTYKKSKQLFFDFSYYNYENLSNESETEHFQFSIYLVFRNGNKKDLKENMLKYATAFYKMFDDSGRNLGGIADMGRIQTVEFYPYVEGSPNVKIAELTIHLYSEIDA